MRGGGGTSICGRVRLLVERRNCCEGQHAAGAATSAAIGRLKRSGMWLWMREEVGADGRRAERQQS